MFGERPRKHIILIAWFRLKLEGGSVMIGQEYIGILQIL